MTGSFLVQGVGTCAVCGKTNYLSRRQAKQAVRRVRRFGRMPVYECSSGYFHYGHLDKRVISGELTREQRYGR